MALRYCSFGLSQFQQYHHQISSNYCYTGYRCDDFKGCGYRKPPPLLSSSSKFKTTARYRSRCFLKLGIGIEDIAAIAHNKVVVATGLSAAIGQLSKPLTRALLYGKDFDPKAALQAGGFPSSHSSAVVATATLLALERGFSDSIFGFSFVYACLVMYDAQGVRREVGNHATALNRVLNNTQVSPNFSKGADEFFDSVGGTSSIFNAENLTALLSKEGRPVIPVSTNAPLITEPDDNMSQTGQMLESASLAAAQERREVPKSVASLNESIGHSEIEVVAGALLGFCVSMAVFITL